MEPPNPPIIASAISSVVPEQFSRLSLKLSTSSGAVLIKASHGAIWSLPKMADAAAICSDSDRPANASCSSDCIVVASFMLPLASVTLMPNCSIISAPSLAGEIKRAKPVFKLLAATLASMPLLAITPMYRAASSTRYPAAEKTGAATDIAFDRPSTSRAELLHAAANTSA